MKLVIDIPEEVYKFIKDRGHLPYAVSLANLIEDGIHYEERPKGKWIADDEWGNCHCSICNFENNHQPYFCENCGADMRGDVI